MIVQRGPLDRPNIHKVRQDFGDFECEALVASLTLDITLFSVNFLIGGRNIAVGCFEFTPVGRLRITAYGTQGIIGARIGIKSAKVRADESAGNR